LALSSASSSISTWAETVSVVFSVMMRMLFS
jgi:hypothetical protein